MCFAPGGDGPEDESLKKILFISNGHGEDSIVGKINDRLSDRHPGESEIHGWPMVGRGEQYRVRGIPIVGAPNLLPSCGFAAMSTRLMIQDLRAGWISTHWRQVRAARRMKGQYDLAVCVGDIVTLVAARLAGAPFVFMGSAKSAHYPNFYGYTSLEKRLLRNHCLQTFPRDPLTSEEMDEAGICNRYVGNPMMDDLEASGETFGLSSEARVIGLLPGSRTDAERNVIALLEVIGAVEPAGYSGPPLHFLFAADGGLDIQAVRGMVRNGGVSSGWKIGEEPSAGANSGVVLRLHHANGTPSWIVKGKFADVLHRSTLAVGLAGTANEQAIGLGVPLITFPTKGVHGSRYVKMKMQLLGESTLEVSSRPSEVARAIVDLLGDPERRKRMGAAGRERMGGPGASAAIAEEIGRHLARDPVTV